MCLCRFRAACERYGNKALVFKFFCKCSVLVAVPPKLRLLFYFTARNSFNVFFPVRIPHNISRWQSRRTNGQRRSGNIIKGLAEITLQTAEYVLVCRNVGTVKRILWARATRFFTFLIQAQVRSRPCSFLWCELWSLVCTLWPMP